MKYVLSILSFTILLTSTACVPQAVKYARGTNPGCQVTELQSSGASVTVLIRCPREVPKTETFTRR